MPLQFNAICFPVNISAMFQDTLSLLLFILFMSAAFWVGLLIPRRLKGEGSIRHKSLFFFLSVLMMLLLIFTKGFTMTTVKGFLMFLLLLQASVSDIKTREVSDMFSVMILLTALIDTHLEDLPSMALALLIVGLPQYLVASFKPGTYGGADIKITASCAFALGVWKGLFGFIIGLAAAIIIPSIMRRSSKQSLKEGIAMIPYLSTGMLLAFIL